MKHDIDICLADWGCTADDVKWVCKSTKNGWTYTVCNSYPDAVAWCERNGFTHN